jgi:carbohydrate diacid regulator
LKRAAAALLGRSRTDTRSDVSIAIGRYHPGLRGLARSYQDAQAALRLGLCFRGANQVHCLDRLGIAAFVGVADERTKIDLAQQLLSPLDLEHELLETLEIFFQEDCHHSSVAKRLAIHRNTLGYRLDKIKALNGLDPNRFDDAVQLRLALLLRSLRATAAWVCKRPSKPPKPPRALVNCLMIPPRAPHTLVIRR